MRAVPFRANVMSMPGPVVIWLLVLANGCKQTDSATDPEGAPAEPTRAPATPLADAAGPNDTATNPKQLRPLANPTCVIRGGKMSVALRHFHRLYAAADADIVELRMAGDEATVTASTSEYELIGDASKTVGGEFPEWVRPKQDILFDDWIRVRRAHIVEVDGAQATIEIGSPALVGLPIVRKTLPCDELTLEPFPEGKPAGKPGYLAASSKIELRVARDGAVVGTFETHAIPRLGPDWNEFAVAGEIEKLAVRVLARAGDDVQIEVGDSVSSVIGWIPARQLGRPRKPHLVHITGGSWIADHNPAPPKTTLRCAYDVGIYLGHVDVVRVGTFRPSATIRVVEEDGEKRLVDLGMSWDAFSRRPDSNAPFVRASDIADCIPFK